MRKDPNSMGRSISLLSFSILLLLFSRSAATFAKEDKPPESRVPLALKTFDEVWRIVYEHHFDTNFNGVDWIQAKAKYRPKAAAAESTAELRDILQEMVDLLQVSHMAIIPGDVAEVIEVHKPGKKRENQIEAPDEDDSGTTGMEVRLNGAQALVTRIEENGAADQAKVQPGWAIKRIGKDRVGELVEKLPKKLGEGKRNFLAWRALSSRLNGRPGSEVEVEFADEKNHPVTLKLKREVPPGEPVQFGSLPVLYAEMRTREIKPSADLRIGVLRFNIWMLPTALAFNKAIDEFRNSDGLVLDLRGNVGGMVGMLIGVTGHFFKEAGSLGSMVMRDNNLKLLINPRLVNGAGKRVEPFSGPVAILVDEITASASEVFAGGMQDLERAKVFGRRTSGQALPAIFDRLPNGDAFYHPVADFIPPKGTRLEGRGVIPDFEVPIDRRALLENRDPVLEKAIDWIVQQKRGKTAARSR
jgi:carboxyl-terminal processing protease